MAGAQAGSWWLARWAVVGSSTGWCVVAVSERLAPRSAPMHWLLGVVVWIYYSKMSEIEIKYI